MRIEHLAMWTADLDRLTNFYATYFGGIAGPRYVNAKNGFESTFVAFENGARLELMKTTLLAPVAIEPGAQRMGLTHLAMSVGSPQRVDELTQRLKADGFDVLDGPRWTGDGYYESVALDPDGNRVEITV